MRTTLSGWCQSARRHAGAAITHYAELKEIAFALETTIGELDGQVDFVLKMKGSGLAAETPAKAKKAAKRKK